MRLQTIAGRLALCAALGLALASSLGPAASAARQCGGPHHEPCGPHQFCLVTSHWRDQRNLLGTCQARPRICPDVWVGVCGRDGKTYANTCQAERAGVGVAHAGKCS